MGIRGRWLGPVGLVGGLLLLVFVVRLSGREGLVAPPGALVEAQTAAPLAGAFEPGGAEATPGSGGVRLPVATAGKLLLYAGAGSYSSATAAGIADPLAAALAYVEERTGMTLTRSLNVVFDRRADACGLDAVAYTNVRTVIIYTCPDTPTRRAVNVLAHELVHQLAQDHYGAPHLQADLILSEGLATWGAGRYWLGRYASFHDFVQREYAENLLPLATDPRAGVPTATLNQLYYQWASYIEWLRATYGADALERLYASGNGRQPGSAAYQDIIGVSFSDTEALWRAWVEQP